MNLGKPSSSPVDMEEGLIVAGSKIATPCIIGLRLNLSFSMEKIIFVQAKTQIVPDSIILSRAKKPIFALEKCFKINLGCVAKFQLRYTCSLTLIRAEG